MGENLISGYGDGMGCYKLAYEVGVESGCAICYVPVKEMLS